jgi:hypothetical protein
MEITMAKNAMPAALSIDLSQTAKNNPAMYALERLHAELDGWAAKGHDDDARLLTRADEVSNKDAVCCSARVSSRPWAVARACPHSRRVLKVNRTSSEVVQGFGARPTAVIAAFGSTVS